MRLKGYLNEEVLVVDEIVSKLIKDCKPYLKVLAKSNFRYMIYRGTKHTYGTISKVKPRNDRTPKDMHKELHNILDNGFKKKFGWKARSEGVFVNPSQEMLVEYGLAYMFFPIGKFKFVWSPEIKDLYTNMGMRDYRDLDVVTYYENRNEWWYEKWESSIAKEYGLTSTNTVEYFKEVNKDKAEQVIQTEIEKKINTYQSTNLDKYLKTNNEASFKCKEYYMVRVDEWKLYQELSREF
jgi:hypothetical protein